MGRKCTKRAEIEEGVQEEVSYDQNVAGGEDLDHDVEEGPMYSPTEGTLYHRLVSKMITPPRSLDWDLLESLGVKNKVMKLLKNLGMDKYALMHVDGVIPLGIEFLTTFDVSEDFSSFTCRLLGKTICVTSSDMKSIFGFPTKGYHRLPPEFNPVVAWYELTGFHNWESGGIPNGFLRDPTVGILHKFLAYCISGNKEANKVNTQECYLLYCAVKNIKICPTSFIYETIQSIQRRSRCKAALINLATCIARQFDVIPCNGCLPPANNYVKCKKIDLGELRGSPFPLSVTELVPQERRHCVKKYVNALAASHAGGAGSSRLGAEEGRGDEDVQDEGADNEPYGFTTMDIGGSSAITIGALYHELRNFKDEWSTRFDKLSTHIDNQFDTHSAKLDQTQSTLGDYNTRLDAQNLLITGQNAMWQAQNEKWKFQQRLLEEQNQCLKDLQKQWKSWSMNFGGTSDNE